MIAIFLARAFCHLSTQCAELRGMVGN